jgi:hypothetical protein
MKSLLRPTMHRTQRYLLASGCSTYCQVRVRALKARPESPAPSADRTREPRSRREEEVDARASSTTSNAEIGRAPYRPEGLRRHGPVFFVAAPRRCRTSPSSRRLESRPMAHATDDAGDSGRALRSQTPLGTSPHRPRNVTPWVVRASQDLPRGPPARSDGVQSGPPWRSP